MAKKSKMSKEGVAAKGDGGKVSGDTLLPTDDKSPTFGGDEDPLTKEDVNGEDEAIEEDAVWDLIRLIKKEDNQEICRSDGCETAAVAAWAANNAPDDLWPLCEPCQEKDFGGWPEGMEPTALEDTQTKPDEEDEQWELKRIFSVADLAGTAVTCNTEGCITPAACAYVSTLSKETWYTCLDCQENDYGGWPSVAELPVKHMTEEHKQLLKSKCSVNSDVAMPDFPASASPNKGLSSVDLSHTVTPCPGNTLQQGATNAGGGITPSPAVAGGLVATKKPKPPSQKALAVHLKWQDAAKAMGGPDARIVVSKPVAKQLIFDCLHKAFRPMNITQAYNELKAVVPSQILKACLDEMSMGGSGVDGAFAESDDEEDAKTKKSTNAESSDPLQASVVFKSAKSEKAGIYYVDHNKLKNKGNGLDPDARNELAANLAKAQTEEAALLDTLKRETAETTKLLSEPPNEEAVERLEKEELELADLKEKVAAARELTVNEKRKQQVKRRIETMASEWRKRRRICMDFLMVMEENTEGTISVKKCLAGDGQIDIDSDEAVAKTAKSFYANQRNKRPVTSKKGASTKKAKGESVAGVAATASFVAVALDAQGRVERIHADEHSK